MTLLQAIILGIVQGLTEFLPISSTAHLRIVPALLGWEKEPGAAFTAVVQIGTLAAVLVYFWKDVTRILWAMWHGGPDARLGWMMLLATIPIVICGLLFEKAIETTFRSLYIISAALIGLALLLAQAEWRLRRRQQAGLPLKELDVLGWREALGVGLAQALALVPGASRSGVTITGGLFLGMSRETAARFSFLMSLPAIFAAGVYKLIGERHALFASEADAVNLVVCTLVSGVVGYLSIAFLLGYLKTHSTLLFIVYRLALGGAILALLAAGHLRDHEPLPSYNARRPHSKGSAIMGFKLDREHLWSCEVEDRAGGVSAKLAILAQAETNLEFILTRRQPDKPGTGILFVAPVTGPNQVRAARAAGFHETPDPIVLRVAGDNSAGLGHRLTQQWALAGITMAGLTMAVIGSKFVGFAAFDTVQEANRAAQILADLGSS